jgi:hypothetical protein
MTMFAQITDKMLGTFAQYGVVGIIAALLLYRDWRRSDAQEKREAERVAAQDARSDRQEQQLQRILGALNALIHSLSLEVLTRPNLLDRIRAEAQENLENTKK